MNDESSKKQDLCGKGFNLQYRLGFCEPRAKRPQYSEGRNGSQYSSDSPTQTKQGFQSKKFLLE